jgi:hypothetical protein
MSEAIPIMNGRKTDYAVLVNKLELEHGEFVIYADLAGEDLSSARTKKRHL